MGQRVDAAGARCGCGSRTGAGPRSRPGCPAGRRPAGRRTAPRPEGPLREILDEADEAFVAFDRDWRYVFVNRPAATWSAATPAISRAGTSGPSSRT